MPGDLSGSPWPGIRQESLQAAIALAQETRTGALVVLQNGQMLAERYWMNWTPESAASVASATKSIVAVLIGICIKLGAVRGVDQPAADFLTEWRGKPHARVLIRHLLNMTSGLHCPPLWSFAVLGGGPRLALDLAAERPPGVRWEYNTAAYRLLFTIIERATGEDLADFTRRLLLQPLGMRHTDWCSRDTGAGREYSHMACSVRDMATFGQFVLQAGCWSGRQLVDRDYIDSMLTPSLPLGRPYGYLFWLNRGRPCMFPSAPADTIAALGAHNCSIFVIPSRRLVLARIGPKATRLAEAAGRPGGRRQTSSNLLLGTLLADAPSDMEVGVAAADRGRPQSRR